MEKIKCVVVDDELFNRKLIIKLIEDANASFQILGEASNVKSAFDLINFIRPEVVFLDVKMPDGSGFELLEMFKEIYFSVVFISGFDSYALKAFEFNALDYILKPINPEKLMKTLDKVLIQRKNLELQNSSLAEALKLFDKKESIVTKIPIHQGKLVKLINVDEISIVQSDKGCTNFITINFERITSSRQLSDFEFIFATNPNLLKINKGVYININSISSYSKGVPCEIYLKDNSVFEVSRRKKSEVLEVLKKNMR
jgi:two-component system LytT family response regulator